MWRSLFIALGICSSLMGVECLVLDKAVLYQRQEEAPGLFGRVESKLSRGREVVPPDWAPWSLMSGGAVTILYSFTIPKRAKE
jgi:hypothetical protein